ncbi:hypothetical protein CF15_07115 [Pyrodictium occultum]|uniref:4Fe-4S ferredoxin-type domain-containing protein n=1 Tax=Pyrodictium occultum TaxID=2309 RepID=A0A0V8RWT3_PYROC|nr:4Fe-4S dicluster domain-containing protein [Pyrodictium occultum]KSW12484.1 hypothetical protein CF15_07115 [Pyrodictium occultum]
MTRRIMVIDLEKCIGCNACTAACVAENLNSPIYYNPPPVAKLLGLAENAKSPEEAKTLIHELLWLRTRTHRVYRDGDMTVYHIMCQHCDDAPCVAACPTGASYQRKDGIVLVNPEKCILCGYCIAACPYGARHVNPFTRTVDKCTLCAHRVDRGELPACVETCPTGARMFGDLDDPNDPVARLVRTGQARPGSVGGVLGPTRPRVYTVPPQKKR